MAQGGVKRVYLNPLAYAVMVEYLMREPCSLQHLALVTGLRYATVARYVGMMRQRGILYVGRWDRDAAGKASIQCYRLGRQPDEPKPPPLTQAQRDARRRQAKREAAIIEARYLA